MSSRDIIQRMVRGQLTENEKRGYSEENEHFQIEEQQEFRKVSFALSKEEKIAIYQDVKFRVIDGMTPDAIGKAVVACMEEHLKQKEDQAYGAELVTKSGKPPAFRRAE